MKPYTSSLLWSLIPEESDGLAGYNLYRVQVEQTLCSTASYNDLILQLSYKVILLPDPQVHLSISFLEPTQL